MDGLTLKKRHGLPSDTLSSMKLIESDYSFQYFYGNLNNATLCFYEINASGYSFYNFDGNLYNAIETHTNTDTYIYNHITCIFIKIEQYLHNPKCNIICLCIKNISLNKFICLRMQINSEL